MRDEDYHLQRGLDKKLAVGLLGLREIQPSHTFTAQVLYSLGGGGEHTHTHHNNKTFIQVEMYHEIPQEL